MVNQNDILKALQEGQDAGTIAQQMTDALNAAIAQKKQMDIAAQRTEAEKRARAVQKEQTMQDIINQVLDFIDEYYPDFSVPEEIEEQFTAAAVIEAMDKAAEEVKELTKQLKDLKDLMKNVEAPKAKVNAKEKCNRKPAADTDAIAAFLRANGLA